MSSSIFDGTLQEKPFVETNSGRQARTVTWKARKLGGKRGRAVRMATKGGLASLAFLASVADSFDKPTQKWSDSFRESVDGNMEEMKGAYEEARVDIAHWALQIGPYLWELHTDSKGAGILSTQRLTGDQIWTADVCSHKIGETTCTDAEIKHAVNETIGAMRARDDGRYHTFTNNCQWFSYALAKALCQKKEDWDAINFVAD